MSFKTFNTILEDETASSDDIATYPTRLGKKKKDTKEKEAKELKKEDNQESEDIKENLEALDELIKELDSEEIQEVINFTLTNILEVSSQEKQEQEEELEEMVIKKVHRKGQIKRVKTANRAGFKVNPNNGKVTKINHAKQLLSLRKRARTLRQNKVSRNKKADIKRKRTMRKFGMA